MVTFRAPRGAFRARVSLPGDKSLSHRALIMGAMAAGESHIRGLGPGADVASTRAALARLGVALDRARVASPGVDGWTEPAGPIDAGNSGTTIRLLAGALAGSRIGATLTGDASLLQRPMARVAEPLRLLGASIRLNQAGRPPLQVEGRPLHGAPVLLPVSSAQVRTAVALAGLRAEGETTIESPPGFRDHTERWLQSLGRGERLTPTVFRVRPGPLPPLDLDLPGDLSSAAFLLAAAALRDGARVEAAGVTLNPGRTGFLDVLEVMGAEVSVVPTGEVLGDPIGDVAVTGRGLRGAAIAGDLAVRTLDELPLVALLAAAAEGTTIVADAAELRVKESDRIAGSVALVRALGGEAAATPDGFVVSGRRELPGGEIDAAGDHRLAMTAAVAATAATQPVTVRGYEASAVSWPRFAEALEGVWSSQ